MAIKAIRTESDLIAAAPIAVQHVPTNSIVVYLLKPHPTLGIRLDGAACVDIVADTAQAASWPTAWNLNDSGHVAVILLAICDERHDDHACDLLDAIRHGMEVCGLHVLRRLLTRNVTEAGQWFDVDSGSHGPTYPYTDSAAVADGILHGITVYRDRDEIAAVFAPIQEAPPLTEAEQVNIADVAAHTVSEIAEILTGSIPADSASLAARAGSVITTQQAVRNILIGLAADEPTAAAALWTRIAQQLRGQDRYEALIIAAASNYLAADHLRAQIALEVAITEVVAADGPDPDRAHFLLELFRKSVPHSEIRAAIATALESVKPPPTTN